MVNPWSLIQRSSQTQEFVSQGGEWLGVSPLKDHHKKKLLPIVRKYEHLHRSLKVTRNEYGMLDDFLRQIRKHDYKLDKADFDVIGDIVIETGASFDPGLLESIAMHIEDFLNQVHLFFVLPYRQLDHSVPISAAGCLTSDTWRSKISRFFCVYRHSKKLFDVIISDNVVKEIIF
jgi:hypothetical protein